MTPQLRQAIQLLQYSNLEASQFVEEELLKNPLLERADAAEAVPPVEAEPPALAPDAIDAASFAGSGLMPDMANAPLDIDVSNTYDAGTGSDGYAGHGAAGGMNDDEGWNGIEAIGDASRICASIWNSRPGSPSAARATASSPRR